MFFMIKTNDLLNSNMSDYLKSMKLKNKTNYYSKKRADRKMDEKIHIANSFMNELKIPLHIRKEIIHTIKNEIKDLKILSRTLNIEQIISLIIFYNMKKNNPNIYFKRYSLFKTLNIEYPQLVTFLINLTKYYQKKGIIKNVPYK